MRGFIEFYDHDVGNYIFLNVDEIAMVKSAHSIEDDYEVAYVFLRNPAPLELACEVTSWFLIPYYGPEGKEIPYRKVLEMIHDAQCPQPCSQLRGCVAQSKEETEPSPRTPHKEKEETGENNRNARTREKFVKPTLEEVAAYMREKGYSVDAEEFWNFYESKGWRVGRSPMRSWKSACVTWQKKRERDDRTEDARMAHIDAKMDEREARREARTAQKSSYSSALSRSPAESRFSSRSFSSGVK